ncbi:Divergent AAA domain protein [Gimesia panareensis]|uniref:Divergent AAA domain protein n=1 Tax=Gimesia panareensis TaxID=2527978 RepID=A0A517QEG4_9PLAN|nr:ATP-binding protein [Gimesia panareensis]QDT30038.1 Divergent AAA domain protein [Gimesia panareensis]
MTDVQMLEQWMQDTEGENLEFKEARNRYDFEELTKYCVALANEGGGKIILGVSDDRPRQVVGSNAFNQPERTRAGLNQRLHLGIRFDEILHPDGRVLVFDIPSRPVGIAIQYDGRYLVRDGDSLVGMSGERLRDIIAESGHDFSADVCEGLTIDDLEDSAIEEFRQRWIDKSGNGNLQSLSREQLLSDIEATVDGSPTYAALILFGSQAAFGRYLANAEVTYEYRSSNASGPAQKRLEFREGFFQWYDQLWEQINERNDLQHFQVGPFVLDVPTFHERGIREAILNAVSHRNYQLGGNVFVRQYPNRIEVVSPGSLPVEVRLETILYRQSPRNRRIADIFTKCGLVERSGQGMNLMFESAIQHSKSLPDFTGTDNYQVSITLHGVMQNPEFVRFLREFDDDVKDSLSTDEWLVLDQLSREQPLPDELLVCTDRLIELGMIVRAARGSFILAESYYRSIGREDTFRRLRENEVLKERLEAHISEHAVDGCSVGELVDLLPGLTRDQVRALLDELRGEERVHLRGSRRWARWHPGPAPDDGEGI